MNTRKCSRSRKRAQSLAMAIVPVALTATPKLIFAQSLTVGTFSSSGYTLNTPSNNSLGQSYAPGDLIDVTHVAGAFGTAFPNSTVISMAIHATNTGVSTTVSAGAIVFDLAVTANESLDLDATSSATTPANGATDGTLTLAGNPGSETLPSGSVVNSGDLITVTNKVGAIVDIGDGTLGGYANVDLVIPSAGGNLDVASNGTLAFGQNCVMYGSGPLTLTGSGVVFLNQAVSNFTGGFIVDSGTLSVDTPAGLGLAGSSPTTLNGGTLSFYASGSLNPARSIVVDLPACPIDVPGTGSITIPGSISGVGGFTKTGTGTLVLLGTNTFSGAQTVAGGTLSISGATQLGATPSTPTPNIILSGGTLVLTANTTSTPFNANRTVVLGNGASGGVGTIDITTTHTSFFNGAFVDSGGAGTLAKIDTGTLILGSGSSTYSGGTNVNGGLLLVNNGTTGASATGSGPVVVGDGATNAGSFGGNGTVAGNITVNSNGTLTPGTFGGTSTATFAPGTVTGGGSLALNTSSTVVEKLASQTSYDTTNIAGNITLGSTVNLTLVSVGGFQPSPSDTYVLFTITGTGALSGFTATTNDAGGTFVLNAGATGWNLSGASVYEDQNGPGGDTEIVLTGVPEPTSAAAVIGSGYLLLRRRRKSAARPA